MFLSNLIQQRCVRYGLTWDDAREMGWFTTIAHLTHGSFETLDTPFRIYGADVGARGSAPEAGEHTFEVLAELGMSEEELAQLAVDGVI